MKEPLTSNAVPVLLKMANSSISQSSLKEIPHPLSSHSHPTTPAPGNPSVSVVCLFDTFSCKWLHAVRSLLPGISGSTRHAQGASHAPRGSAVGCFQIVAHLFPHTEGIPFGGLQRTSHVRSCTTFVWVPTFFCWCCPVTLSYPLL